MDLQIVEEISESEESESESGPDDSPEKEKERWLDDNLKKEGKLCSDDSQEKEMDASSSSSGQHYSIKCKHTQNLSDNSV